MKTCKDCLIEKEKSEFYKDKKMKDGYSSECKECKKIKVKANPNRHMYDKTEKGVIKRIYADQRTSSVKRNHPMPSYTKDELREWLYSNRFKELYDTWVKLGYSKGDKPSVDRLNSLLPYTIDNIKLDTWNENMNHQLQDIRNGVANNSSKPLIQYLDRVEVARYISVSQAKRIMGYSMDSVIRSGNKDKRGFTYKFERE